MRHSRPLPDSPELLAALVRALRRQGAVLSAERDEAYYGLRQYEEGIGKLLVLVERYRQTLDARERRTTVLEKRLESSLRWRKKLIARVRALQAEQTARPTDGQPDPETP